MRVSLVAAVVAAGLVLSGCRSATLQNVENAPYGDTGIASARQLTLDEYARAIVRAGTQRNWVFQSVAPGHLEGRVDVRGKHNAVVDVYYDAEVYSIVYKSSQNLKYDAAENTIHPNYNSWVQLLSQDIRAEVQRARAS
ncbi:MAG: hypothetical protein AAF074_26375 [Pseudomonadota bacterium]